ncbi:YceD family protein [Ligilactobacillus faecis]|uniref:YceD family protein n=1 Tax=Ligilactobacillus faecis TaxID=762833 RepID=UPI0024698773|nr:YceD family protein [Ligilactobacillus faecis]WGN89281.1 YceD family protein [Ligilactobacillus faecis]
MKWSLNELRQTVDEPLRFKEVLDLKADLMKRRPDILDVSDVLVEGLFSVDELGVLGYLKIKTTVVLPSTRSLEPATIALDFDLTEHYVSFHERDLSRFEDTDVVIILENDILDLKSVVEDNILLQIPMQVLTEAERKADASLPTGSDWSVISEGQLKKLQKDKDGIDPRFAKLKDFFEKSE